MDRTVWSNTAECDNDRRMKPIVRRPDLIVVACFAAMREGPATFLDR